MGLILTAIFFFAFGHRLRAADVSFEDRQDLLGHKSERITTHYSAPDIARLLEAAEKVCVNDDRIRYCGLQLTRISHNCSRKTTLVD